MKKNKNNQKSNKTQRELLPLGDRVIIRPFSVEDLNKTKSGIIIPDTVSKESPEQGEVLAVGPGRLGDDGKRMPMSIKKGDKVVFSKYAYEEVKIDEEKYYILKEENILAVIG